MRIILTMGNVFNVIPIVYMINVLTTVESAQMDVKTAGQDVDAMMRVLQLVIRVNDTIHRHATLVPSTITVRHVNGTAVRSVTQKEASVNAVDIMVIAILDVLMVGLDQNVQTVRFLIVFDIFVCLCIWFLHRFQQCSIISRSFLGK